MRRHETIEKYGMENTSDHIPCLLCAKIGRTHLAHNLSPHIRGHHHMNVTDYEDELGLPIGTAMIVSGSVSAMLKICGKKGAAHTNALKQMMEISGHDTERIEA